MLLPIFINKAGDFQIDESDVLLCKGTDALDDWILLFNAEREEDLKIIRVKSLFAVVGK